MSLSKPYVGALSALTAGLLVVAGATGASALTVNEPSGTVTMMSGFGSVTPGDAKPFNDHSSVVGNLVTINDDQVERNLVSIDVQIANPVPENEGIPFQGFVAEWDTQNDKPVAEPQYLSVAQGVPLTPSTNHPVTATLEMGDVELEQGKTYYIGVTTLFNGTERTTKDNLITLGYLEGTSGGRANQLIKDPARFADQSAWVGMFVHQGSQLAMRMTFDGPPRPWDLVPGTLIAGKTQDVVLQGENLGGLTGLTVASQEVSDFESISDTEVRFSFTPESVARSVEIVATNRFGQSEPVYFEVIDRLVNDVDVTWGEAAKIVLNNPDPNMLLDFEISVGDKTYALTDVEEKLPEITVERLSKAAGTYEVQVRAFVDVDLSRLGQRGGSANGAAGADAGERKLFAEDSATLTVAKADTETSAKIDGRSLTGKITSVQDTTAAGTVFVTDSAGTETSMGVPEEAAGAFAIELTNVAAGPLTLRYTGDANHNESTTVVEVPKATDPGTPPVDPTDPANPAKPATPKSPVLANTGTGEWGGIVLGAAGLVLALAGAAAVAAGRLSRRG